ncbi:putative ribonuclease H-like domain-containing protein [Tanacetum coccineum]
MNRFYEMKGIKIEFSVARTPQQNGVAERKNMTLIEAAKTMLADSLLPTTFWAKAVNTACYVQNRVLVTKPHNKTPYELLLGRPPSISFMRPFGCPVTILNTLDPLGKFDGKADEGSGPEWLFNIDSLTKSMSYEPITAGNQTNGDEGIETNVNAGQARQEKASNHEYILLPLMLSNSPLSLSTQSIDDKDIDDVPDKGDDNLSQRNGQEKEKGASNKEDDQNVQDFRAELDNLLSQQKEGYANNTNRDSTASPSVSTDGPSINTASENINTGSPNINTASPIPNDSSMQSLENTVIFDGAYDDEDVGAEADLNNLETTMNVSVIPTTRIHKDHPKDQIIRDINSATQTRRMIKISEEHAMVIQALTDPSWIEVMQEELLQFKLQNVWTLVDLPKGKRAIGTKWVYRNKKDERGIVVRNRARLVAQGYTQEEGIDYDKVFALVSRIKAIRLFLAYASFMGFIIYQMDVKSAFLYGTIEEEVYVCQPPGFEDPQFPDKVYKVEKALYGLHQAPRAWYETLSTYLLGNGFRRGTIDKTLFIKKDKGDILLVHVYVDDIIFRSTKKSLCVEFEKMMHKRFQMSSMRELTFFLRLQVQQKEDGIFISQDKYVADILKKFDFITVKTASTPIKTNKALLKDEEAEDVDVYLYKSMIGSLMYLTASRPDIMFAICACISDYAGASLDRKSTTGAEYVAAANCCGQVLWIQNQMIDYGFNFMNTKIHIDNESTICIVKNPVFHSKTKHIEIRHHFIRDYYEKKLIQVIKNHTDHNVADLLTKAFDVSRCETPWRPSLWLRVRTKGCRVVTKSGGPIHLDADETVYKEWEDRMERAATNASSLEADRTMGTDSGSGPRCQDTILGDADAQIRFEAASKQSNDLPLSRVNTLRSGEDSLKLMELMEHCTKLSELTSAKVKTINRERQIQALVDKKKVIISETSIRSDLKLDDVEGTDCLPIATIFPELERMGYENLTQKLTFYKAYFSSQWKFLIHTILQCLSAKTTSWNEFSSIMASAIICLATNQKFNLSKYIFNNMVKNLDGGVKFLMYLRFVQVFLDKQVEGMSKHKEVYVTPSHTKKVFSNMKRPCKGFSGRITPLFSTMMVQATEDMGADSATPTDSHSTPIITQPSSSKPQKKKSRRKQRKDSAPIEPTTKETTPEEHVSTPSYDPPPSGEDRLQLAELMSLCTNLQEKVLDLEKAKTAQAKEITSLTKRAKQLEQRRKSRTSGLRRLRKVSSSSRVESSNDASLGAHKDTSKQGRKIANLDADAEVTLVDETQEMHDDNLMFDTITTAGEVVTTASSSVEVPDKLTLAQTLIEIKTAKPKPVTTAATIVTSVRPRAKGIIFHD